MNKSDGGVPHLMSAYDHVEPTMSEQALPTIEEILTEVLLRGVKQVRDYKNHIEPESNASIIAEAKAQLQRLLAQERVKALIRLEQWAKLHDLDAEQILDGIEHMSISELQFPNQRHVDYPERTTELESQVKGSKENTNG